LRTSCPFYSCRSHREALKDATDVKETIAYIREKAEGQKVDIQNMTSEADKMIEVIRQAIKKAKQSEKQQYSGIFS